MPGKINIVNPVKTDIIKEKDRGIMEGRSASGRRQPAYYKLNENDINKLLHDIKEIGADPSVFKFNEGDRTGFSDRHRIINVKGDVFPDASSSHPRDLMSARAVLAHEYYGHYKFSPSKFYVGDWRDEMRASYIAALYTPNLTDYDRKQLMVDAYERAREAGRHFEYSKRAKVIIYGDRSERIY